MCAGKRGKHIIENHPDQGFRHRAPRDVARQRRPGQPLHHDERHSFVFAAVVNRDDVRVIQRGGRPRLGLEAQPCLRVIGEARVKQLDRDRPAQAGIQAIAHLGHASPAQDPSKLVAATKQPRGHHVAHAGDYPNSARYLMRRCSPAKTHTFFKHTEGPV